MSRFGSFSHYNGMVLRVRPISVLLGVGLALGCSSGDDEGGGGSGDAGGAGMTGLMSGGGSAGGSSLAGGSSDGAGAPGNVAGSGGGSHDNGGSGNANGGRASGGTGTAGSGMAGGSSGTGGSSAAGMGGSSVGTGGSSGGSTSVDPYGDARTRCVNRTNELRATKGLGPIPILTKAEPCVDGQAKADSISGKAHGAFNDCLNQVNWMSAAQNECPNYPSVEATLTKCLDAMWAEGPGGGHYDNMVGDSTKTACGFYTTPSGKVWMVQDFWTE